MSRKTFSEALFEEFCDSNSLICSRVPEGANPSPDYRVTIDAMEVYFEIKEIAKDDAFSQTRSTRTIGDHVRARVNEARNQMRAVSASGSPTVLLIYNKLDPLQVFGTEEHDFLAAMYGEPTVVVSMQSGQVVDSFHGRNASFREGKNESFSAVGQLKREASGALTVHVYENTHAKVPLRYESLPGCISFSRITLERDGAA